MGKAAERASFEAYVRDRTPALLRLAYLLTGNAHDAEDLVQTTLEKAALCWRRLDDPEAYVRRAMYNQSISRWRRIRARPPETPMAVLPERATTTADPDARLVLAAALRRLTPKQRAVLVLRYYEDRSEAEAAAMLGVSHETVKSQTRHALRKLRQVAPELESFAEVAR